MRSAIGVRLVSRVKGRPALLRSLRQLRLRVQRFALHRATSLGDRTWAAQMATALDAALAGADGGARHEGVQQPHGVVSSRKDCEG